jgi:hypothetical protein
MTSDWSRKFEEPIPLGKGRQLITLKDAGNYITKLPKAEHTTAEWQAAMEALLLVAERDGPTMFARIGVMRGIESVTQGPLLEKRERPSDKKELKGDGR